jgi:hypothetical protein
VRPGNETAPASRGYPEGSSAGLGSGPVAVCTLTDRRLAAELRPTRGVGLTGSLMTANLGIGQMIWAVLDRPAIRYLLVCGSDSQLFRAGQSLVALMRNGVSATDRRIIGATGYLPFLRDVSLAEVVAFRRQVRLVDLRGQSDADVLRGRVSELVSLPPPRDVPGQVPGTPLRGSRRFATLRPGGRREPVARAGGGFFVIFIDRRNRHVVVEHYLPDLRAGHQMRGVRAESMLLGLIGAGVVDSLSHAGYLGMELVKAETALRLGLDYEQDTPLRMPTAGIWATELSWPGTTTE